MSASARRRASFGLLRVTQAGFGDLSPPLQLTEFAQARRARATHSGAIEAMTVSVVAGLHLKIEQVAVFAALLCREPSLPFI
jgi:hypothetical protein